MPPNAVILAFGDSLTFGTGAPRNRSYPAVLEQRTGLTVINSGIPGEVTAEGRRRLPGVLSRSAPDLVILCHGGNDLLRRLAPEQTRANLLAMITAIREAGAEAVLVAVPQPGVWLRPAPVYLELCAQEQLACEENILPDILGERELKSDTIHPNEAGYAALAEALQKLLQRHGAL